MTDQESFTNDTKMKRLRLIHEYIDLQKMLIAEVVSKLDPTATEYDFEYSMPTRIIIDGNTWSAKAHGLGIIFSNPRTKIVVDSHVGFLDTPTAFDAWRLVQYCESLLGTTEDLDSWKKTLDELAHDQIIEPLKKNNNLYVLK